MRGIGLRARGGDAPRTGSQKILASHCDEAETSTELTEVRVDQVVLAREPNRVLRAAVDAGLRRCAPEVNLAYPPRCMNLEERDFDPGSPYRVPDAALALGFLMARPGAGFASAVHLERFASPGRVLLTDEARLATCGAAGMMTLPASRAQLVEALITGRSFIRTPRSLHILLSGRLRPFVSSRDASLELIRNGLRESVRQIDSKHQAPVILEFGGPGAKHLSIGERATLCALAPTVGAAGALFGADERTETFLREQRRSKAHRTLNADVGAPWEAIFALDLAAVEPLAMGENGEVHSVREFGGQEVSQVLLGGDTGFSLRDCLAISALLKSKRVAPGVDFLLCPPSRQHLEVLAHGTALPDLIMTGARLIEPDRRVITGEVFSSDGPGLSLRNSDHLGRPVGIVVSPETLAYAVAHGEIGDPRGFKRPVRITVPRNFPTDDVLILRGELARGCARGKGRLDKRVEGTPPPLSSRFGEALQLSPSKGGATLLVAAKREQANTTTGARISPHAFIATSLEDIRWLVENSTRQPHLRALVASHIPAATVSVLSGLGIFAFQADPSTLERLAGKKEFTLPEQDDWTDERLCVSTDDEALQLRWLARGAERTWAWET